MLRPWSARAHKLPSTGRHNSVMAARVLSRSQAACGRMPRAWACLVRALSRVYIFTSSIEVISRLA